MKNVDSNYVTFHVSIGYNHDLLQSTFNDDYHRQVINHVDNPNRPLALLKLDKQFELGTKK